MRRLASLASAFLVAGILLSRAAGAATLFGQVAEGGSVVSDASGSATVEPGAALTVSIFLDLAGSEVASSFDAAFDLVVLGVLASPDPASVGSEWLSVVESSVGAQSSWAEISANAGGQRLVARWIVDASAAAPGALFRSFLAPGAVAGRDLDEDPFFALVPIDTASGTLLAEVLVVPEPASGALASLGLLALGFASRSRAGRLRARDGGAARGRPDTG